MPIFEDLVGTLFGGFQRGAPPLVTEILLPWANKVGLGALARWSPIVGSNIQCDLPVKLGMPHRCAGRAVAGCGCCKKAVCLDHAMVAANADVICLRCVNEMLKITQERVASAAPPPGQDDARRPNRGPVDPAQYARDRRKHLKVLGIEDDEPEVDDIKAAYRRLVAKMHPDRFPEDERKAATKRFLKIQQAYDFLIADAEKKVA